MSRQPSAGEALTLRAVKAGKFDSDICCSNLGRLKVKGEEAAHSRSFVVLVIISAPFTHEHHPGIETESRSEDTDMYLVHYCYRHLWKWW